MGRIRFTAESGTLYNRAYERLRKRSYRKHMIHIRLKQMVDQAYERAFQAPWNSPARDVESSKLVELNREYGGKRWSRDQHEAYVQGIHDAYIELTKELETTRQHFSDVGGVPV